MIENQDFHIPSESENEKVENKNIFRDSEYENSEKSDD